MNGNTPSYFIKISTLTKLLKMNSAKIQRDLLAIHIEIILCTSMHVYQNLNLIRVLYVYELIKVSRGKSSAYRLNILYF